MCIDIKQTFLIFFANVSASDFQFFIHHVVLKLGIAEKLNAWERSILRFAF